MIETIARVLALACVGILLLTVGGYVLREWFLHHRARRLGARMDLLRDLAGDAGPDGRAFRTIRKRRSTWRDLQALEQLLEERRVKLGSGAGEEELRALHESYDKLGIVDRYVHKLENGRGWAERAFAARFLGEIGSVKAVAPLIRVMRNTREEDRDVRMAASRALGRIRDPRALEPLLDALAAPESWLPARVAEVVLQFGDGAFEPLVRLVQRHDDTNARAWACQILGDLGNARAVPVLLGCLADINDQVRARAASALGKLGDKRAVADLIRIMLADPVPYVRIQVVRALGALGDPRALHYLIDALKDGEWWVRIRVVEALEQLGEQAIEPLYLALEDRDKEVRARAAMTLERLGALDRLIVRLADLDAGAREKLLVAGQAGVVEILIEALEHADPRVRFMIVEILGEIRNPAVSVALVARLEKEPDPRIRAGAVRALASAQETSAAVAISKLLGDANDGIRIEAVRALERILVEDPLGLLGPALRDPEPRVRAGAAVVLGKVGAETAVESLLELLSDADATVRTEAARALGLLRAEAAVPRLMESFYDHALTVQVASARALGQIGSSACLETLVRGLENAGTELGGAIAWAVGQISWSDPERLIDVLFQGNDRSSRMGALAALAQMGHDVGRELIRSMLGDADEVVVEEAVRMLGRLRDRDALPQLHALLASPMEATRLRVMEALCAIADPASAAVLRQSVFDPSPRVRAQAVLALGALEDRESADLLRGILVSERSTPEMQAHALLVLMAFGRDTDLEAVLEGLQRIALYEFLHERHRLEDPVLRGLVERVQAADCIEFRVASTAVRADLEASLVQDLGSVAVPERRVRIVATLQALGARAAYPAVWRTFYKDPSEEVRVAALRFLAVNAPADEFFRLLVDALNDLQPRVRSESVRHLHAVPVERVLPLLRGHLSTRDAALQATLVEYLAALADEHLDEFLDGVMGADLEPAAREVLVRVLGRTRHHQAADLLATFLEGDAPELRRAAVETLNEVPAARAAEMIQRCLGDPDVQVRLGAVDAAAGLGATNGGGLLRHALADPAAVVRRAAVLRLARLEPHAAGDAFRAAARDADEPVRAAALAALLSEGSEPVEDALSWRDIPAVAQALQELAPGPELEARLVSNRPAEHRVGALKALVFRDARWRQQALAAAQVDPAPLVRNTGARLEELLQRWLREPGAAAALGVAPAPEALAIEGSLPAGLAPRAVAPPVPAPAPVSAASDHLRELTAAFAEPLAPGATPGSAPAAAPKRRRAAAAPRKPAAPRRPRSRPAPPGGEEGA